MTLSCAKDEDLFLQAIDENIQEEIEQEQNHPNGEDSLDSPIEDSGAAGELKAFPAAYGAGAYTIGGRGGKVLEVTNLKDDGSIGSLRWALEQEYPRIVVFKVSGTINLSRRLNISGESRNFLTVAGQTAPEGGITIKNYTVEFWNVDNLILRYLTFRGAIDTYKKDGIAGYGCDNVVLDHISVSYAGDEAISWRDTESDGPSDVTIQNCLMAEGDPRHNTGTILGSLNDTPAGKMSYIGNLNYNISHRFPNVAGQVDVEAVNNVIYNWKERLPRLVNARFDNITFNQLNNYYYWGEVIAGGSYPYPNKKLDVIMNKVYPSSNDFYVHSSGNIVRGISPNTLADDINENNELSWSVLESITDKDGVAWQRHDKVPHSFFSENPFDLHGAPLPLVSAEEAFDLMKKEGSAGNSAYLDHNGVRHFYRDELDTRYISDLNNGNSTNYYRSVSEFDYPTIPSGQGYLDSDHDGMPDDWEIANGFNPTLDDSSEDEDGDGYTNIEEFLNLIDL